MPEWSLHFDLDRDALVARTDQTSIMRRPVHIVPIDDVTSLTVARQDPSELLGVALDEFTDRAADGLDLPLFESILGTSLTAEIDRLARLRSSGEIRTDAMTTTTQDVTNTLRIQRLRFLRNLVNARSWEHVGGDIIMNGEFSFDTIADEAGVSRENIDVARRLIANLLERGTDRGAATAVGDMRRGNGGGNEAAGVNLIPSQGSGPCQPILVVACFGKDSFAKRLQEAIEHVSIICKETRLVLFVTSRWELSAWRAKEHLIPRLGAQFTVLIAGPDQSLLRLR